jgi:hypothetical protein
MFTPVRKLANAKLTEAQVRVIKQDLKDYHEGRSGDSPSVIAHALGLSTETIRRIDRGETWGWVSLESEEKLAQALSAPLTPEMEALAMQGFEKVLEAQRARDQATRKMAEDVAAAVKGPERELDAFGKE